ncbi:MAG TPA: hypothetical protein VJI46_05490 [Candidatus Nanoarchaeia archaeon]|nr:hypothetical protein [Candidatus Nanoarchaeia archaeon]
MNEVTRFIIRGVRESPLEKKCKIEAVGEIRSHAEIIRSLFCEEFMAPEVDLPYLVANYAFDLIIPVLEKHKVPHPNGRDAYRHICQAVGGGNSLEYEVG